MDHTSSRLFDWIPASLSFNYNCGSRLTLLDVRGCQCPHVQSPVHTTCLTPSLICSLRRAGTSDETALLAAEFALLDEGLAALRVAIDRGQAALIGEQELDHLASEIPDMRSRLGIRWAASGQEEGCRDAALEKRCFLQHSRERSSI